MEAPPPDVGKTERTSKASSRLQPSESELETKAHLFKAGFPLLPSHDDEKKSRTGFSSQVQYVMAVIGVSVGLGNIWRFPAVAYANGGGAFLIPYLCMGLLLGLPMLYIDSSIGQFSQSSPSIAFKQYFPAAQGLGWTMACILISIGFYYVVPCTWSFMYIIQLIMGRMSEMSSCLNEWNSILCDSSTQCINEPGKVFYNRTCMSVEERNSTDYNANYSQSAQQEFFISVINRKHASFEFGNFNVMFAGCLFVCWALTGAGLIKGVQSMGKISLVTTSLPYFIMTILFFRGVTLEGAGLGIEYFLTKPDWSKIFMIQTWRAALSQSAFSLSVGCGPMIMMASYNKREHPNYRDSVIILCADTFMSILGGTTVFSILGSMEYRTGKKIEDIIQSPLTLAFIAYPEATSQMPLPTIWALLFFVMLFMVGMSTMFVFVEGLATCIIDEHPRLAKLHWLVVTIICAVSYALNLVCYAFQNGYHIFNIFDAFLGAVSMPGALALEIMIIMTYYGAPRLFRDIQCMHGLPTNHFYRFFGNLGLFIKITVTFITPILAVIMAGVIVHMFIGVELSDGKDENKFHYPQWTIVLGSLIGAFPLFFLPIGAVVNLIQFKLKGEPLCDLFRISDDHPSVRYNLPDPVPWKEYFFPPLRSKVAPIADSVKQATVKEGESIPSIPERADSILDKENPPPDASVVQR